MPTVTTTDRSTRPGTYARGTEKVDQILKAALAVLIDEGAGGFTLRRIAARCDMQVGNLSYHFPRKEALVQHLLDDMMQSYESLLDRMVRQSGLTAEARLARVITICLDDIATRRTTHLFTELWALANHNDVIADRVEGFYRRVHAIIGDFVRDLNPALSADDIATVALYISASMEGTTPFLGHGKPWADKMPQIRAIAVKTLVELARTVSPADIRGDWTAAPAPAPGPFMLRQP